MLRERGRLAARERAACAAELGGIEQTGMLMLHALPNDRDAWNGPDRFCCRQVAEPCVERCDLVAREVGADRPQTRRGDERKREAAENVLRQQAGFFRNGLRGEAPRVVRRVIVKRVGTVTHLRNYSV